jgi:hypothetical protein
MKLQFQIYFVDKELICVTLYKLKDKNVKD